MSDTTLILTLLLGGTVGTILGLTGAGGSIFAVPLLMWGLGWTLPQAAPVALISVAMTAAFGTAATWDVAQIRYRAAMLMSLAGMLTAPLGLAAARHLPAQQLTGLFAVVLVLAGIRMFLQARRPAAEPLHEKEAGCSDRSTDSRICRIDRNTGRFVWNRSCFMLISGAGMTTGFLAGLLGVGGGFVIVPVLRAGTELSIHSAIATSLMVIAITSAGTAMMAMIGGTIIPWALALPFVIGSLAGMLGGRRLARRIGGPSLQRFFSALMLAVAAALMWQSASAILG